ncbi:Ferritin-like metal-binding protein YciE [Tranquillimonas rosea]|uniref:Ferritin-like metal-binding protein YciE n=1 Tax=Tranquillimonas rosea TaxID=641238 RepID=A0A1H9X9N8_9RHOB|nr:ferritin-like domain-containing protein [Tranquillimonas rosea]SES42779.1 Ferritin-like metal-binding protein YciE [Tranquillimonas rosea]
MPVNSLKDLYLDQLQDLHSACTQALPVIDELGRAADDKELSQALIQGQNGTAEGIEKIARICGDHGVDPAGEHCKGMQGLVAEARAHGLEESFGDPAVRDAMLITQYQRMMHYAIAGYGCLMAFANRLELDGDAAILQECLDETRQGDEHLTRIAKSGINASAA